MPKQNLPSLDVPPAPRNLWAEVTCSSLFVIGVLMIGSAVVFKL